MHAAYGTMFLYLALNAGISILNVYYIGVNWAETEAVGGWRRFMSWVGAATTVLGFTYVYLTLLAVGFYAFGALTDVGMLVALYLGFKLLIPGVLCTGYIIMLNQWGNTFRDGGYTNWGLSTYDTYANYHNTMSAVTTYSGAHGSLFGDIGNKMFSDSDDKDNTAAIVVVFIILLAACLGLVTTIVTIKKLSASHPLPEWKRDEEGHNQRSQPRGVRTAG